MVSLFTDEDFPGPVTRRLRQANQDVITVAEAGLRGKRDEEILKYATSLGRPVLTLNRHDYIRLHSRIGHHAGIIVCTNDAAALLTQRILDRLAQHTDLTNQLIRINRRP